MIIYYRVGLNYMQMLFITPQMWSVLYISRYLAMLDTLFDLQVFQQGRTTICFSLLQGNFSSLHSNFRCQENLSLGSRHPGQFQIYSFNFCVQSVWCLQQYDFTIKQQSTKVSVNSVYHFQSSLDSSEHCEWRVAMLGTGCFVRNSIVVDFQDT